MSRALFAPCRLLATSSLVLGLAAACGGGGDDPGGGGAAGTGRGGDGAGPSAEGGAGFELGLGGDGSVEPGGGGAASEHRLLLSAEETEIVATGEPVSVRLLARFDDGSYPNRVTWTVSDPRLGSVNDEGQLSSSGFVAGELQITASVGAQTASITVHIMVAIQEDDDELEPSVKDALVTGGEGGADDRGPDAGFRFLYPYDGTVFPLGLAAPDVQLGGDDADGTYLKLKAGELSYEAFAAGSGLTRVRIPEPVWRGATLSVPPGRSHRA